MCDKIEEPGHFECNRVNAPEPPSDYQDPTKCNYDEPIIKLLRSIGESLVKDKTLQAFPDFFKRGIAGKIDVSLKDGTVTLFGRVEDKQICAKRNVKENMLQIKMLLPFFQSSYTLGYNF